MSFPKINVNEILLEIGAVKVRVKEPFSYASGLFGPIYCDNRTLISFPIERRRVIHKLKELSREFSFQVIGGTATAGIPHASFLASELNLPMIYVRSGKKEHGRKNQIEGVIKPGQRVLLIEDLVTTGGSALNAVKALRESGLRLAGVLSIFSYENLAAIRDFEQSQVKWISAGGIQGLLSRASELQLLSEEDIESVRKWAQDPVAWSKNYRSTLNV